MIGRPLSYLDWYEIFAIVRLACCILRTQVLRKDWTRRSLPDAGHPILPA
jgi:hypothetical protein